MKVKKRRNTRRRSLMVLAIVVVIVASLWHPVYKNVFLKAAYPEKYQSLVTKYSAKTGLDPNLVYAVIRSESSFNPDAKSSVGALGLMQITPDTFDWAMKKTAEEENYTAQDLYTPDVNVRYGTIVLSSFLNEFGNEATAIAAYHAGRGIVNKWLLDSNYSKDGKTLYYIPFSDTRAYVQKVEETKSIYAELYGSSD